MRNLWNTFFKKNVFIRFIDIVYVKLSSNWTFSLLGHKTTTTSYWEQGELQVIGNFWMIHKNFAGIGYLSS